MNTQTMIENMLTGQIEMRVFVAALKSDAALQDYMRSLIPNDAINNPQHPLWAKTAYESYKRNGFDFLRFLNWICKFDDSLGDNLNIFSCVSKVYTHTHPQIVCTKKYDEAFDLYLDAIKDCYDGPEVRSVVEQIVYSALGEKTKGRRIKMAKEAVKEQFHLSENKRPRWIHGPEWPMGEHSPMAFVSQTRKGECVYYCFVDVDSNETKTITQFY